MNKENSSKYEVFQLGADKRCVLNTDTVNTQRNNNVLVIGGTGAGKTTCVSNNMLLGLENSNAVVVCTKKGEMDTFSRILKSKGYNVCKIDFLNSLGRGATFKEISKSIVEHINIPLPSLVAQERMAAKLDAISEIASKREEQFRKLDQLVKSRFVEAA